MVCASLFIKHLIACYCETDYKNQLEILLEYEVLQQLLELGMYKSDFEEYYKQSIFVSSQPFF